MGADKSDKPQREVAVSIIYDQSTSRILMVTRRKHPKIWICECPAVALLLVPACFQDPLLTKQYLKVVSSQERLPGRRPSGSLGKRVSHNHTRTMITFYPELTPSAGCPRHLDPPPKLLSLDLEPEASKRYNVYWHIHVIHTTEDAVNSTTDW
jgi:hypothetical protein